MLGSQPAERVPSPMFHPQLATNLKPGTPLVFLCSDSYISLSGGSKIGLGRKGCFYKHP